MSCFLSNEITYSIYEPSPLWIYFTLFTYVYLSEGMTVNRWLPDTVTYPVIAISLSQPQTRHAPRPVTVTSSDKPCLVLFPPSVPVTVASIHIYVIPLCTVSQPSIVSLSHPATSYHFSSSSLIFMSYLCHSSALRLCQTVTSCDMKSLPHPHCLNTATSPYCQSGDYTLTVTVTSSQSVTVTSRHFWYRCHTLRHAICLSFSMSHPQTCHVLFSS